MSTINLYLGEVSYKDVFVHEQRSDNLCVTFPCRMLQSRVTYADNRLVIDQTGGVLVSCDEDLYRY
jgi:hypothetical protein